jgi:hypothetical protein
MRNTKCENTKCEIRNAKIRNAKTKCELGFGVGESFEEGCFVVGVYAE